MPSGAVVSGKEGRMSLGGVEIAMLREWTLRASASMDAEPQFCYRTNAQGGATYEAGWEKQIVTSKGWGLSANVFWQRQNGLAANDAVGVIKVGDLVDLVLLPTGTSGTPYRRYTGQARVSSVEMPSVPNAKITQQITLVGTGALTEELLPP